MQLRFYLLSALVLRINWNYEFFSVIVSIVQKTASLIGHLSLEIPSLKLSNCRCVRSSFCCDSYYIYLCFFPWLYYWANLQPLSTKNMKYLSIAGESRCRCVWILLEIFLIPWINFVLVSLFLALIVLFK